MIRDTIAKRVAKMFKDGEVVNLGIGIQTEVPKFLPKDVHIVIHSENGMLGMGPLAEPGEENKDYFNAGGLYITAMPGAATFPDLSKLVRQNQFLDNIRKFLSNRGPDFSFFSGYSIGNSCITDPFYFSNKLFNRHMSLYFNMPGND